MQSKWKPARTTVRQEEAAVALYLVEDAPLFEKQDLAWQGLPKLKSTMTGNVKTSTRPFEMSAMPGRPDNFRLLDWPFFPCSKHVYIDPWSCSQKNVSAQFRPL